MVVIDEDDQEAEGYLSRIANSGYHRVSTYVAPESTRGMVAALNLAFNEVKDELGFAVGFQGDDHRPRTQNWDLRYLESLRSMRTGFVYGNDLFQGQRMPTQIAMTTDIPKALGYMCPPALNHLNVDIVWKDWGDHMGRIQYLDDVIVEHMHPLAGKSKMDKGYAYVNSPQIGEMDAAIYRSYIEDGDFQEDLNKLYDLIGKHV